MGHADLAETVALGPVGDAFHLLRGDVARRRAGAAPSLSSGTLALDGEREIEFSATDRPSITLDPSGPFSVDVPATLAYAARHRLLAGQRTPMTP
ncbi:hypothetical protein Z046_00170 [Pseudomonas aeruginosa VRFPA09]|nr:hypothetical protein Z046_00170 [Pseudomonas aeruginosa VRFPA09]